MKGTTVDFFNAPWETSDEPGPGGGDDVRWTILFSGRRTPTGVMSMGLAEIAAGGVLPMHRHAPGEIYHILEGEGWIDIEGARHGLAPGTAAFIPPDAWHETTPAGPGPLRFLFVFSAGTFEEIVYEFADQGEGDSA